MPHSNSLQVMLEQAAEKQSSLNKLGTDWKRKIDEMKSMMSLVKGWQETVFERFGKPKLTGKVDRQWKVMEPGELAPFDQVKMDRVKFSGATIVQGLAFKEEEKQVIVTYKAMLLTDENYFLRQMLPPTVPIPVHDPAYTLFDLEVAVPRQELVQESIFSLGEVMGRRLKAARTKRSMRRVSRFIVKHAHVFGWVVWGSFGVWCIASLIAHPEYSSAAMPITFAFLGGSLVVALARWRLGCEPA